jgi:hypothetical protein
MIKDYTRLLENDKLIYSRQALENSSRRSLLLQEESLKEILGVGDGRETVHGESTHPVEPPMRCLFTVHHPQNLQSCYFAVCKMNI